MAKPPNNEPQTIHYHQRRPIAEGHMKTSNAVNGTERIEEDALGNVEVSERTFVGRSNGAVVGDCRSSRCRTGDIFFEAGMARTLEAARL